MSEQENTPPSPTWPAYWQARGQSWRREQEVDTKRQQHLTERRSITPDIQKGIYPFKDVRLFRGDVEWLLATHEGGRGPVVWADESQRDRIGIDLRGADLHQQDLSGLPLARTLAGLSPDWWPDATPEQVEMAAAHFEGANLGGTHQIRTHLEGIRFTGAHLEGSNLRYARLERADLHQAHLEAANLTRVHAELVTFMEAHLGGANLQRAHLEGVNLTRAVLGGYTLESDHWKHVCQWVDGFPSTLPSADLRQVFFDAATDLEGVILADEEQHLISVADIRWDGVNLAVVNWPQGNERRAIMLGDEYAIHQYGINQGKGPKKIERQHQYEVALRANRQISATLRGQGINEVADYFAYRAHILQRELLWLEIGLPTPGFKQKLSSFLRKTPQNFWQSRHKEFSKSEPAQPGHSLDHARILPSDKKAEHKLESQGRLRFRSLLSFLWQQLPLWVAGLALIMLGVLGWERSEKQNEAFFATLSLSLALVVLQLKLARKLLKYLGSLFLDVIAGYGYKSGRTMAWYIAVTSGFAMIYAFIKPLHFFPDAYVLSVTAFHGRGFFPGLGTTPSLHDPLVFWAALEAVIGLFIEISFIASFTQRFFNR